MITTKLYNKEWSTCKLKLDEWLNAIKTEECAEDNNLLFIEYVRPTLAFMARYIIKKYAWSGSIEEKEELAQTLINHTANTLYHKYDNTKAKNKNVFNFIYTIMLQHIRRTHRLNNYKKRIWWRSVVDLNTELEYDYEIYSGLKPYYFDDYLVQPILNYWLLHADEHFHDRSKALCLLIINIIQHPEDHKVPLKHKKGKYTADTYNSYSRYIINKLKVSRQHMSLVIKRMVIVNKRLKRNYDLTGSIYNHTDRVDL